MSLTTDRNDPCLKEGAKGEGQNECYLILSEEERKKGFVRPYRDTYIHKGRYVGILPIRELTEEEKKKNEKWGYVAFVPYPEEMSPMIGTYLTQKGKDSYKNGYINGCGTSTTMGRAISETYARDPKFYGSTYCVHCGKHYPVEEFVWEGTNEKVGS